MKNPHMAIHRNASAATIGAVAVMVMLPILIYMYVRLAHHEEQEALAEFGDEYTRYRANTPSFFPKFGARHQT